MMRNACICRAKCLHIKGRYVLRVPQHVGADVKHGKVAGGRERGRKGALHMHRAMSIIHACTRSMSLHIMLCPSQPSLPFL